MVEATGNGHSIEASQIFSGIELLCQDTPTQDSVMLLRWCIKPWLVEKLQESGARYPQLLFCVTQDSQEKPMRQVVPLDKGATFIHFQSPGKHRVYAQLVAEDYCAPNSEKESTNQLRRRFLSRNGTIYEWSLFDWTGDFRPTGLRNNRLCEITKPEEKWTSIEVDVDSRFFAKNPPPWLIKWVEGGFSEKSVDQCQFRGRMIYAFTLKPIIKLICVVVLPLAVTFLLLILFLVGCTPTTKENWRVILRSLILGDLNFQSDEIVSRSVFYGRKVWGLVPLAPLSIITVFILLTIIKDLSGNDLNEVETFQLSVVLTFFLGVMLSIVQIIIVLIRKLLGIFTKKKKGSSTSIIRKKKLAEKSIRTENQLTRLALITCQGEETRPTVISVASMPKQLITIRLRLGEIKKRVCRPFAR